MARRVFGARPKKINRGVKRQKFGGFWRSRMRKLFVGWHLHFRSGQQMAGIIGAGVFVRRGEWSVASWAEGDGELVQLGRRWHFRVRTCGWRGPDTGFRYEVREGSHVKSRVTLCEHYYTITIGGCQGGELCQFAKSEGRGTRDARRGTRGADERRETRVTARGDRRCGRGRKSLVLRPWG
jgi:hypothetical protein